MAQKNDFVEYLLELLHDFGNVRARAMFGGYGIYKNDLMFAIVAENTLYLKVDEENKIEFERADLGPFVYENKGKEFSMSYHLAPADALDNANELIVWADKGYQAALRQATKKPAKKATKKQTTKKAAKKATKKKTTRKVAKKVTKKQTTRKVAKKVTKKQTTRKVAKKVTKKKTTKKTAKKSRTRVSSP